jgi:GNAT superfamily N-acetyltransferase
VVSLRELAPAVYAREVLPLTAPLWSGRRTFDEYVAQTLEMARSRYGRRHYRTIGLYDGRHMVASFKRYERTLHDGSRRLAAIGFGAVFTPPPYRRRGYASVMLAMALDRARKDGLDLAFLFSDIHPQFYSSLGFRVCPSREFTLRADSLPSARQALARLGGDDWTGVRRVYELQERRRRAGFLRSAAVWDWIATGMRRRSEYRAGEANFVVHRRRRVVAYVFGVRDPGRDAFVLDEFGFADDTAAAGMPALLRAAAGDLRRVTGWLPPESARDALPRLAARKRKTAIFMMAPLHSESEAFVSAAALGARGDFCWPADHV